MFATARSHEGVLGVKLMGSGDVDGIDSRVRAQFLDRLIGSPAEIGSEALARVRVGSCRGD